MFAGNDMYLDLKCVILEFTFTPNAEQGYAKQEVIYFCNFAFQRGLKRDSIADLSNYFSFNQFNQIELKYVIYFSPVEQTVKANVGTVASSSPGPQRREHLLWAANFSCRHVVCVMRSEWPWWNTDCLQLDKWEEQFQPYVIICFQPPSLWCVKFFFDIELVRRSTLFPFSLPS